MQASRRNRTFCRSHTRSVEQAFVIHGVVVLIYIGGWGVCPAGKSFWFLRARFRRWDFCLRNVLSARARVPFPCRCGAYCNVLQVKFTWGVGYQCKMNGNVSCTFPDGGSVDSFDFCCFPVALSFSFLILDPRCQWVPWKFWDPRPTVPVGPLEKLINH